MQNNQVGKNIPAKFKFTRWSTSHMHAPLVFFNWSLALWTRLWVGKYPERH